MNKYDYGDEDYFANILNDDEESIPLSIAVTKDIKVIRFLCLYKKVVRADGLMGLLGFTKEVSEKKKIIIQDNGGIKLHYNNNSIKAFCNFSSLKEFDKITTDGCDPCTLSKVDTEVMEYRYQINFLIANLTELGW